MDEVADLNERVDVRMEEVEEDVRALKGDTGGKGSFTQCVHGEFIVGSETICPPNIHWVQGEYL